MRDLKFRAWNKKQQRFAHAIMEVHNGKLTARFLSEFGIDGFDPWQQYTGLNDKNGVEIYEGDIINIEWVEDEVFDIGTVEWSDAGFRFVMENEGFAHDPKTWADLWNDPEVLLTKVIGNIYENEDMLK